MQFKDQLNRTVRLSKTPKRIVSLVPSQTELLVDLGLKENLVGVTKFCVHPKNLRKETSVVGGTKKVHFDEIRYLEPDIIICNKEENTEEMVFELEKIAPVWLSDICTVKDSLKMILDLGEIFEKSVKASEIAAKIKSAQKDFEKFISEKKLKKVVYLIWKNPYMAASKNTFIDSLLKLNKFENILSETTSRYPEISLEEMRSADLVLLSSEPFPFKQKHLFEIKNALHIETRLVDGEYFSWYGSRLIEAFNYFKTLH